MEVESLPSGSSDHRFALRLPATDRDRASATSDQLSPCLDRAPPATAHRSNRCPLQHYKIRPPMHQQAVENCPAAITIANVRTSETGTDTEEVDVLVWSLLFSLPQVLTEFAQPIRIDPVHPSFAQNLPHRGNVRRRPKPQLLSLVVGSAHQIS